MPVARTACDRSRETTTSVPSRPPSFREPSFIGTPDRILEIVSIVTFAGGGCVSPLWKRGRRNAFAGSLRWPLAPLTAFVGAHLVAIKLSRDGPQRPSALLHKHRAVRGPPLQSYPRTTPSARVPPQRSRAPPHSPP